MNLLKKVKAGRIFHLGELMEICVNGRCWSCAVGTVVVVFCAAVLPPRPHVPVPCVSQDTFLSMVFIQQ